MLERVRVTKIQGSSVFIFETKLIEKMVGAKIGTLNTGHNRDKTGDRMARICFNMWEG